MWSDRVHPAAATLVALVLLVCADETLATIEEFESWRFDVLETDDEYALDHLANSFPHRWEDAWKAARQAVRITMGCASYEKWETTTQVKLTKAIGRSLRFAYRFEKVDRYTFRDERNQIELGYHRPNGTFGGAWYRPNFDKDFHDIGIFAGLAIDSLQGVRLSFGFEDLTTNSWTQNNYLIPRARWKFDRFPRGWDLTGRFRLGCDGWLGMELGQLMRTEKRISPVEDREFVARTRRTLSGERAMGWIVAPRHGRLTGWLRAGGKHAEIADRPIQLDGEAAPESIDRSEWWVRPGLDVALTPALTASALTEYRERREENRTPAAVAGRYLYSAVSRIYQVGVTWRVDSWVHADFGLARNSVRVHPTDDPNWRRPHRDLIREENRAFIALEIFAAGVHFRIIEGIELDDEGYRVVGIHDKGFVQVMATF